MAAAKSLYEPNPKVGSALHTNFDVDYVIVYRFATTSTAHAEAQFVKLVQALNDVGLATEVRNGDNCALLIFVKVAAEQQLRTEVFRSRLQDWLYGVRTVAPEKDIQKAIDGEPITEAERLRLPYLLITKPRSEGGAGITPKEGEWKGVESVFALHDQSFNNAWLKDITSKQLLQVPFAIGAALLLGGLIATCFGIEIFISEVYGGPFKTYLVFLPTIILTTVMPTLSALLTVSASHMTELENYENQDAYEAAMVSKIFILNFITSYLPIFLTAFVYVPFAQIIVPYLDIFQLAVRPFAENEKQMTTPKAGFQINPDRLKKQVIYFTVTAQIVSFALEIIVPFAKRRIFHKVKEVQADRAAKRGGSAASAASEDHPEEASFLARVRNEAELDDYDVTTDFREMIVQFGYLSLFSVVWPLTGVSFFINNWIELRGDATKIALGTKRPVPWRSDSIGPWLDALGFLAWLGSLTSAALVYLFSGNGLGPSGTPWDIKAWGLLLTIFFSEHIYLAIKIGVRKVFSKLDSPGLQKERSERYLVRKKYLEEIVGREQASPMTIGGIAAGEKTSRGTIEDEARNSTLRGHGTLEESFWGRQRGQAETIAIGRAYIQKAIPKEKRESKKEL
ncbi:DUF590-domain-containing protein [Diplocarpon rosae]|nr:DUF590-domain-containing protein [Diplocarpon rosae]